MKPLYIEIKTADSSIGRILKMFQDYVFSAGLTDVHGNTGFGNYIFTKYQIRFVKENGVWKGGEGVRIMSQGPYYKDEPLYKKFILPKEWNEFEAYFHEYLEYHSKPLRDSEKIQLRLNALVVKAEEMKAQSINETRETQYDKLIDEVIGLKQLLSVPHAEKNETASL